MNIRQEETAGLWSSSYLKLLSSTLEILLDTRRYHTLLSSYFKLLLYYFELLEQGGSGGFFGLEIPQVHGDSVKSQKCEKVPKVLSEYRKYGENPRIRIQKATRLDEGISFQYQVKSFHHLWDVIDGLGQYSYKNKKIQMKQDKLRFLCSTW